MNTTSAIRKPIEKLARADLAAFPIWEWAIDEEGVPGQDESWVRSTSYGAVPPSDFGQYLVSAIATLRDGREIPACVEVTRTQREVVCSPLFVFHLDRHLEFVGHETRRILGRYTKVAENRPASWKLTVLVEGENKYRSGKVSESMSMRAALGLFKLVTRTRGAKG